MEAFEHIVIPGFAPESRRGCAPFNFIVRIEGRIDKERKFCGTGFLISPRHLLTCAHVVNGVDPGDIRVRCADQPGESRRGALVATCLPDVALIRLDEQISQRPVPLITNVRTELEPAIAEQRPVIVGFSSSHPEMLVESRMTRITSSLGEVATGRLLEVQIEGGRGGGMSGSPVLVEVSGAVACLGMLYLGGEGAATSRFLLAGAFLRMLQHHGVDYPAPLDAADVFWPRFRAQCPVAHTNQNGRSLTVSPEKARLPTLRLFGMAWSDPPVISTGRSFLGRFSRPDSDSPNRP